MLPTPALISSMSAQLCMALQRSGSQLSRIQLADQLISEELQAFLQRMLIRLGFVLPSFRSQAVSNSLWAFAKLRQNPDALSPGIVDAMARRFMADIAHAKGQEVANLMLACKDLQLNPCNGALIQALLHQLSSSDMSNFNSQDIANIANSLTRLPSAESTPRVLDALCSAFFDKVQSVEARDRPNSQETANYIHSMAKLPAAKPSTQLLDALCGLFFKLLQSSAPEQQPTAQHVANFAWALQQLKHVPSPVLGAAMLSRVLQLCHVQGQQPNSQDISNMLLASAELRVELPQQQADALVTTLLAQSSLSVQALANTAWSLAILGDLQLGTFKQLLQSLHAKPGSSDLIADIALGQLYLALDWLAPPSGAKLQHQKAWSELQAELRRLGPRPQPQPETQGTQKLKAALAELKLPCNLGSVVTGYALHAVVQPPGQGARPLLINLTHDDCFSNQPSK